MRYVIMLTCYLLAQGVYAQRFWLTTPEFPTGSKTCLAGTQDTILFVGVYGKGVWKSRNGGYSWQNTLPGRSSVFSLRVTSANLVVAGGTGKIYYSRTLGETWDSVQLDTAYPIVELMEDRRGGLYALTRYEDEEVLPTGDGVFYSAGNVLAWQKRNQGLPPRAACEHIATDRRGRLYLATVDYEASGQRGLFISDDSGLSWSHLAITVKGKTDREAYPVRPQFNYGITITPQDSVMCSFTGLGANFGVYMNVIKHIDDIDQPTPWRDPKSGGYGSKERLPVHITRNGDYYSSVDGTQKVGTLVSKDLGQTWVSHSEGLGLTKTGYSTRQVFYETSYGLIYMIRYLDDLVYWTDASVVNAKRIYGRVTDGHGAARMAEFNFSGQDLYRTSWDGTYFIIVPTGWSGTVRPYQRTHTFAPAALVVHDLQEDIEQNFTATYATVNYLLSGKVVDATGRPMAHVPLVGLPEYMETAADGTFAIVVPAGWTGSVTPVTPQHQFNPSAYRLENLDADREMNFTAGERNMFHIGGTISDASNNPMANVTVNGPTGIIHTDAQGRFSIEAQAGWTGTLTPLKAGYAFLPAQVHVMPLAMDISTLHFTGEPDVTGIPEDGDTFMVRPYPNPTNGDVHIDLPQPNGGFRLEVYTMTGQLVRIEQSTQAAFHHTFHIAEKGMFVVKVMTGQKLSTGKIVVQ